MWNSFQSTFYFETAEPNCFCVHVFVSVYRTASHAPCLSFRWLTSALDDTWVLIKRASCAWRPTTWCWDIWTILRRRREHWMRTAGFIQVRAYADSWLHTSERACGRLASYRWARMRTAGFIQVSAYADGWLHTGAQRNTLDSEIASAFHETCCDVVCWCQSRRL